MLFTPSWSRQSGTRASALEPSPLRPGDPADPEEPWMASHLQLPSKSDSQDSADVSHGFVSLRTVRREGSASVSLWNMTSSSLGPFVFVLPVSWLQPSFCPAILFPPPLRPAVQKGPSLCLQSCVRARRISTQKKRHGAENEQNWIHHCDML